MKDKLSFLPFHAINEFMRDDFRMSIIRNVLNDMHNLSESTQTKLNKQISKSVKIPGFRNPSKAPSAIKLIPTIKAFEKNPELVATILSAWVEGNLDLRDRIYEMLKARNWSFFSNELDLNTLLDDWRILPAGADRTKLPGFYPIWPNGENFENLYEAYTQIFPQAEDSIDTVSLMVVWMTMRLPYQVDERNLEQENGA